MGQVPYAIVGDGRAARHFRHYFNLLGVECRSWSRRLERESGIEPARAFEGCQVGLALISDSAIEPWIEAHPELAERAGIQWVHFSGALQTRVAVGAHPLMSFAGGFYPLELYRSIPFVTEMSVDGFRRLFPGLPNPVYAIESREKPLYHAYCVMAGNFTTLLWQGLFERMERQWKIPREAALPYLRQITANLERDPAAAMTGPLQRGDRTTIRGNLEALEGDRFQSIYEAFVGLHEKPEETA